MGYIIDLSKISIEQYKEKLKQKTLIPSRMILKEKLNENFSVFKKMGMKTAADLFLTLKNKNKFTELANNKELSGEYLTVLFREMKSIQAKPIKLTDFHWIKPELINKLAEEGIKNTAQLYEKIITKQNRDKLADKIKADME